MRTVLLAAALLAGCAPALAPGSHEARPDAGGLLRLEDRRELDEGYLLAAAADRDPALRRRAALAAGRIGDRRAFPVLAELLADRDSSVAATAAFALGQLGDTAAVPLLVPFVHPARIGVAPTLSAEAAYALGKLRHDDAKAALATLLAEAVPGAPGTRETVGAALWAVWRHPRPLPLEGVVRWLGQGEPELRRRAAYALSRRADPEGTAALLARAGDADPLVRAYVARSLGGAVADSAGIGRARALDVLLAMSVGDADRNVRINALRTLGGYDDPRAVARLAAVLGEGDAYLAHAAMESLQRQGAGAASTVPALEAIVRDSGRHVSLRQAALGTLGAVEIGAGEQVARDHATDPEWRLRAAAARVLVQAGERAWPAVSPRLGEPDGRVAAAVLDQLLTTLGPDVAPATFLFLEGLRHPDPVVRARALAGLSRTGVPSFLPLVFDVYRRAEAAGEGDVALAAVETVAALAPRDPNAWAAFFETFPRSENDLVRRRVHAALGDTLTAPWGPPLPVETGVAVEEYRRIAADAAARPLRRARIETDRGTIEIVLFAADAPLTVRNFLALAESGYFDGQEWPRVVPNFVIQGGDPRGDTSGGPGYTIRDEANRHLYHTGALGMALSGPDTGGSQWFLAHAPQPHLDGIHTVFGAVVAGKETVDAVLPGDRIIRIREIP